MQVGDLVHKINRRNSEVGTSIWVVIRYHGDDLWEIANTSDMSVTQFSYTASLRRVQCK